MPLFLNTIYIKGWSASFWRARRCYTSTDDPIAMSSDVMVHTKPLVPIWSSLRPGSTPIGRILPLSPPATKVTNATDRQTPGVSLRRSILKPHPQHFDNHTYTHNNPSSPIQHHRFPSSKAITHHNARRVLPHPVSPKPCQQPPPTNA